MLTLSGKGRKEGKAVLGVVVATGTCLRKARNNYLTKRLNISFICFNFPARKSCNFAPLCSTLNNNNGTTDVPKRDRCM